MKEAKNYIDDAIGRKSLAEVMLAVNGITEEDIPGIEDYYTPCYLKRIVTEYEGFDIIQHYDKNGYLSSAVKIIPDDSYIGYHYGKPKRV